MEEVKPIQQKPHCNDCGLDVEPCGWGAEMFNNTETVVGIINTESARSILDDLIETTLDDDGNGQMPQQP